MINNWAGVRNAPLAVAVNPSSHVCSVDEKTNDCLTRTVTFREGREMRGRANEWEANVQNY